MFHKHNSLVLVEAEILKFYQRLEKVRSNQSKLGRDRFVVAENAIQTKVSTLQLEKSQITEELNSLSPKWQCMTCTLENAGNLTSCEACDMPRE